MESSYLEARKAILDTVHRIEKAIPAVASADLNTPMTLHAVTPHLHAFETSFGREVSDVQRLGSILIHGSCGLPVCIASIIGPW